jgi:serine/threonine-protein kinase
MSQERVSSRTFVEEPANNLTLVPGDLSPEIAEPQVQRLETLVPPTETQAAGTLPRRSTILPVVKDGPPPRLIHIPQERYAQVRLLGEGGMGTVALAQDQDIGRPVAIKTLRSRFNGPSGVARFVDEIHTVGRLEHPNIVPIHDVGIAEDGSYFFVMKYVEGDTLEDVIERLKAGDPQTHQAWPFERRVTAIKEVLFALAFAHDRQIIHRDIKPANIMIGRFGEVFLTDWGIAKSMGSADQPVESTSDAPRIGGSTQAGVLVGSPAYMSPEQFRGENDQLDARSDIYSLGMVFFEFLTLKHPWPEGSVEQIRDAQLKGYNFGDLFSFKNPNQELPPVEYLYLCQKLLTLNAGERIATTTQVIDYIENLERGHIPVQCAITFTKRMSRESSRVVERYPIGAVVLLVGIGVFSVAWLLLGLMFVGVI